MAAAIEMQAQEVVAQLGLDPAQIQAIMEAGPFGETEEAMEDAAAQLLRMPQYQQAAQAAQAARAQAQAVQAAQSWAQAQAAVARAGAVSSGEEEDDLDSDQDGFDG